MEVRDISELDLNGVLFVFYPDNLSLADCRERLELEIMFAAMEDGPAEVEEAEIGQDGKPYWTGRKFDLNKPVISPYWIQRVLSKRTYDAFKSMSLGDRKDMVSKAWHYFLSCRRKESRKCQTERA